MHPTGQTSICNFCVDSLDELCFTFGNAMVHLRGRTWIHRSRMKAHEKAEQNNQVRLLRFFGEDGRQLHPQMRWTSQTLLASPACREGMGKPWAQTWATRRSKTIHRI